MVCGLQEAQTCAAVAEPTDAEFLRQRIGHVAKDSDTGDQRPGKPVLAGNLVAVNFVFTAVREISRGRLMQRHRRAPDQSPGADAIKSWPKASRRSRTTAALSRPGSFASLTRSLRAQPTLRLALEDAASYMGEYQMRVGVPKET